MVNVFDWKFVVLLFFIGTLLLITGAINLSLIDKKGSDVSDKAVPGAYALSWTVLVSGLVMFGIGAFGVYKARLNSAEDRSSGLKLI